MNFKDQVERDLTAVFHNSREHADVVEFWIDGIRYKGPVIIDDGGVVGMVSFAGYKIPLYRFNVSPTLPVQRATVSAAVLAESGRTPFAHAFIAKMKSGHTGMFERDGTGRLPITEFMGPSAAQMAANSVVVEQVEEKAQEVINKRIEHEITRILNGYGG